MDKTAPPMQDLTLYREWVKHPGYKVFQARCQGPWGLGSWKDQLDSRMRTALTRGEYDKARYYQGQIELLAQLCDPDFLNKWGDEIEGRDK